MSTIAGFRHVVVTPSRNESLFLPELAKSMLQQSIVPSKWIVVLHNTEDESVKFLNNLMEQCDWISVISVNDKSKRRRGSQIASLINKGLESSPTDWGYFSKIDADMILPSDYFERLFAQFSDNPNLGIASGSCFLIENRLRRKEKVSKTHTRGGLKTYRRECFDHISGIREVDGWDGVDNILAQMEGWETVNFPMIEVHHRRRTGSSSGLLWGCFETGRFAYSMRYFFPFILARSIHQMFRKPILIGGIAMFFGYIYGKIAKMESSLSKEEVKFLHKLQKNRLFFWRR